LMIWSSRARNRSPDPVVSCFFGRIAPSDAATESCFSIRGNCENEFASSRASDTETLQSQVNKAAKKRLSLSGLEILHGRLFKTFELLPVFLGRQFQRHWREAAKTADRDIILFQAEWLLS